MIVRAAASAAASAAIWAELNRSGRLARKAPLRGTSSLQRGVPLQRSPIRSGGRKFPPQPAGDGTPPRKSKAPSPPVPRPWPLGPLRELVKVRAAWRCDRCGIYLAGREYSIQHRRSRSAGGVKGHRLDTPWNLVLLCGSGVTGCHGLIETTAARRSEGYEKGFAIEGWAQDPADVPILRHGIEWVIPSLDDDESLPLEDRGLWVPADPILVLA